MVELCFLFWSVPRLYIEIPRKTEAVESQLPVGHSHGKFIVEEELEVSLRKLSVLLYSYMCYNYSNLECFMIICIYDW
jgi:hypothetical protein